MIKALILSLCIIVNLTGTETRLSHPDSFVDSHVNVIDGSYSDLIEDLALNSAIPLSVYRYYASNDTSEFRNLGGWRFNSHCYLFIQNDASKEPYEVDGLAFTPTQALTTDLGGQLIEISDWAPLSEAEYTLQGSLKKLRSGCNWYLGEASGKSNPSNIRLNWNGEAQIYTLILGNGCRRVYTRSQTQPNMFLLQKERLPSSMYIYYEYNDLDQLMKMWGTPNEDGQECVWINFTYERDQIHAYASDNQWVKYQLTSDNTSPMLQSVASSSGYNEKYEYNLQGKFNKLTKRSINGVCLEEIVYDQDRVQKICYPQGRSSEFTYESIDNGGKTTFSANGLIRAVFDYNSSNLLLQRCDYLNGCPYRSYKYIWGSRIHKNMLIGQTVHDQNKDCYLATTYNYDPLGNIARETVYGNLTGKFTDPIPLDKKGLPSSSTSESFSTEYEYSKDGLNLLLKQHDIKGGCLTYKYVENTDLLLSCLTYSSSDDVESRTIYEYTPEKLIRSQSTDNSSSKDTQNFKYITEQTKWEFQYSTEPHSWGVPIQATQSNWDKAAKELIQVKSYAVELNSGGLPSSYTLKDENGVFQRSIQLLYDNHSRLIKKDCGLGRVFDYSYDPQGRLQTSANLATGAKLQLKYDPLGNILEKRLSSDALSYQTHYSYDVDNNPIEITDYLGNSTFREYDSLGRLTKEQLPDIETPEGVQSPITTFEYDIFDSVTKITGPQGSELVQKNTVRGTPYARKFDSELTELFKYDVEGSLHRHRNIDGNIKIFEYDYQGQLTGVARFQDVGGDLDEHQPVKGSYNLLNGSSFTSPNGIKLESIYTPGNRRSTMRVLENYSASYKKHTLFDVTSKSLGQSEEIRLFTSDGQNPDITKQIERDALGRMQRVQVTNASNEIQLDEHYLYQKGTSNITHITGSTDHSLPNSDFTATYDPFERLIELKAGNTWNLSYDSSENALGQNVPVVSIHSQDGTRVQRTYDALGQLSLLAYYDPSASLRKKTRYLYDLDGNLVSKRDALIDDNHISSWQDENFSYSPTGLLTCATDGLNRTFHYQYDATKLVKINGPGDRSIDIKYNSTRQLKEIKAHDSFGEHRSSYHYSAYETLRDIDSVHPGLNQYRNSSYYNAYLHVERKLNGLGRVEKEEFSFKEYQSTRFKYSLSYKHDLLGRIIEISGPQFKLKYEYDGLFIKKISKLDDANNTLYFHEILKRDPNGEILEERLIGKCGQRVTTRSFSGEKLSVTTDFFKQYLSKKPQPNTLIELKTTTDNDQQAQSYETDALEQITKETGPFSNAYTYNSLYYRQSVGTEPVEYDNNHRPTYIQGNFLQYDEQSNISHITKPNEEIAYEYDPFGQLTKVKHTNGMEIEYYYDGLGRRLLKVVRQNQKIEKYWYLYVGDLEIGMIDEKGDLLELRVPLDPNNLSNDCIAFEFQNEVFLPVYDLIGNVALLVDPTCRDVVESYQHGLFGQESIFDEDEEHVNQSPIGNPWRYAGTRTDYETNLVFYGARYYHRDLYQWISPDPLGSIDCPNLYAYRCNNPIKFTDPLGLSSESTDPETKLNQFFYGEVEPPCVCETHRNCKRGGNLGIGNMPTAMIRSSWNWFLESVWTKENYYIGKFYAGFDYEDLLIPPSEEQAFIDSINLNAIEQGNAALAQLFPADELSDEYQTAYEMTDIGLTVLNIVGPKCLKKLSPKVLKSTTQKLNKLHLLNRLRSIKPYKVQKKLTKGHKGLLQAHHLLEVRHQKNWLFPRNTINNTPSVILSKLEHDKITKSLRRKLPYGLKYSQADVLKALEKVYKDHPDWIESVREILK